MARQSPVTPVSRLRMPWLWHTIAAGMTLILMAGAGAVAAGAAETSPAPVFACNDFPPHKLAVPVDGHRGYDIDILTEALASQGIAPETVFYPWQRALQMAEGGRVDGLCSCSFRPERAETLLFSESIGDVGIGLFSRIYRASQPLTIENLRGLSVGVVRGYSLAEDLKNTGAVVVDVSSDDTGLRMLEQGRIDAYYGYRDTVRYLSRGDRTALAYVVVRSSPYYICVSRGRPGAAALLDQINRGILSLMQQGTLDRFREPYR